MTLSMTLLGLAVVGAIQVFFRYVLHISFAWFEEAGRYLGVFITFLGSAIGVRYGIHFTMDMVVTSLRPPWSHLLKALIGVISGLTFVVVAYYGFVLAYRNYGYETTSPVMQIPMYWPYLPIPVFSVVMAGRFFKISFQEIRSLLVEGKNGGEGETR